MFNQIINFLPQKPGKIPFFSLFLIASMVGFGVLGERTKPALSSPTILAVNLPTDSTNIQTFPQQDGIYLYGQSTQSNQPGQGYIVFQKQHNKVTGALYMPNSEFSCFQGTIQQSGELAMTVTSSPGEIGVTKVSTTSTIPRIYDSDSSTYAYSVALQNYHQLNSVSANDESILQMCNR